MHIEHVKIACKIIVLQLRAINLWFLNISFLDPPKHCLLLAPMCLEKMQFWMFYWWNLRVWCEPRKICILIWACKDSKRATLSDIICHFEHTDIQSYTWVISRINYFIHTPPIWSEVFKMVKTWIFEIPATVERGLTCIHVFRQPAP